MNKEQMVAELTLRVQNSNVNLGGRPLLIRDEVHDSEDWEDNLKSVEGLFDSLLESNLTKIIESPVVMSNRKFSDYWAELGREGCFSCDPILYTDERLGIPVLRLRHDEYVAVVNESIDVYDNKDLNNPFSWSGKLSDASEFILVFSDLKGFPLGFSKHWLYEALFISYLAEAGNGHTVFYKEFNNYHSAFDGFIEKIYRTPLVNKHVLMRQVLGILDAFHPCPPSSESDKVFDVALSARKDNHEGIVGRLCFYTDGVALYTSQHSRHSLIARFATWNKSAGISISEYYLYLWERLVILMFMRAGIRYTTRAFHSYSRSALRFVPQGLVCAPVVRSMRELNTLITEQSLNLIT